MSDPQWWAAIIASIAFIFNLLSVVIGGVWIVGRIQSSTERLATTIDHLSENVARQQTWLGTLQNRTTNHGERIAVMESQAAATAELADSTRDLVEVVRRDYGE